jgi:hypothetical protein
MLIFNYDSKRKLKECIGQQLRFTETSMFGAEYQPNGVLTGANRPHITGRGREFFANVTLKDGVIVQVK